MKIDELQVLITANTSALQKEIEKANSSISGLQKTASNTQKGLTSVFKKLKTGIIALGIGKVIKDSIKMGMDAIESDSLFETSLNKYADSVRDWSDDISEALGLSAVAIRKNTGIIYNMTNSMGVAEKNALKMSKGISLLTEDMASFYNLDSSEAFNKLRAGLTGETEPLKALGILVDENTIKQVAYSEGIAKTGTELTQQQKVLARYVAILKQTGNAQGDLARTINSPANQLRLLKNQVTQIGLSLSNFFIPILQAVLPYVTAFAKVITLALNSLARFLGLKSTNASDETAKINSNISGLSTGLDKANKKAKQLKGTMASIDEFHTIQEDTSSNNETEGYTGGGSLGFDLSEYDAHLDLINNKTDKIVNNIMKLFQKAGKLINSIWSSEPVQAYVNAIKTYGQFAFDFVSTLGGSLVNNLKDTWNNIKDNLFISLDNMSQLWTSFWTDISNGISVWGQPIIDGVNNLFNSIWKDAIDPAVQQIIKIWTDFTDILLRLWQEHGEPLLNNIGEFVDTTIGLFQQIWDRVLQPIIKPFLETLSWLWDEHLKKMIEQTGEFVMKLYNDALEIYNQFIAPVVSFLVDILSPIWVAVCNALIGTIGTIVGAVVDVASSIFKTLGGIIDFITGIFTGNWKKAWQGVKDIFGGIVDGLVALFKVPINCIIDGINTFISGVNAIKLPDWEILGDYAGKGFNIPKIPKLARGGVVGSPTVALIGEAGKEAVMPLENNTGWIDVLADKLASKLGGNNQPAQHIEVDITGELTAKGDDLVYVYDKNKKDKGYDGGKNPKFAY